MKLKRNLIGIFSILTIAVLILCSSIYLPGEHKDYALWSKVGDNSILQVKLKRQELKLEVASSNEKHAYGLMYRDSVPFNEGMLFVFAAKREVTFYMKDTLISLDIIYLDDDLKVVKMYQKTKPNQTDELYPSTQKVHYVLELNGGWSERFNLKIGDKLEIVQIT